MSQALNLSEEDNAAIVELKKQVDKAWAMADASAGREEQSTTALEKLRSEQAALLHALRKQQELLGGDATLEDVIAERNVAAAKQRETDALLVVERGKTAALLEEIAGQQDAFKSRKDQLRDTQRQLTSMRAEEQRDKRKLQGLDGDLVRLRIELEGKDAVLAAARSDTDEAAARAAELEAVVAGQLAALGKHAAETARWQAQLTKAQTAAGEEVRSWGGSAGRSAGVM